jgi:hypothetical protein
VARPASVVFSRPCGAYCAAGLADEHRSVSQPTAVATFALSVLAFGGMGLITPETTRLFLVGLPVLAAGTLLGWSLYGKQNEVAFRKVVLALLLISGLAIVASA